MKRQSYLAGAALCGLVIASPAMAQVAEADQAQASSGTGLSEIVVTANRRAQRLQDVPIAVNALSGDSAIKAGITGTESLQQNVPGLQVTRQANQARPFIRGIGSQIGDANAENSVAIYIDGVYQPASFASFFDFNNIERIEVLKGPQGTLFGRNATGGVIQVITKDPNQDQIEADVSFGYANYDTVSGNAYISTPLTEDIAFNVAVMYKHRNKGWGTNLSTGADTPGSNDYGVRAKLLFTPGDSTEIRLSGNYSRSKNPAISTQPVPGAVAFGGQGYPGQYNVWHDFEEFSNIENYGGSLRVDHDFDAVQLVSISAYNESKGFWRLDQDLSSTPLVRATINQAGKMFSQEVHLLSPAGAPIQWLVGGYYYNYKAGHVPLNIVGFAFDPTFPGCLFTGTCSTAGGLDWDNRVKSTSKALFGQATAPLGEQTNLTLGFRYTWDKSKGLSVTTVAGTDIVVPAPPGLANPNPQSIKYGRPTWRISLDHEFTSDIMGYASYNRGAKSGNITVGSLAWDNIPYRPERLDAYEVGLKTELFDRAMRFNISGFYYDFKDIQFQKIVQGASFIFNGGSAKSYGVEFDLETRPIENLTLTATGGWLKTKIGSFDDAPNTCRDNTTGQNDNGGFFCNGPNGLPDPGNLIPFDAKGNKLPSAPKWTASAGFVYDIPTAESGTFSLTGNVYYNDGFFFELDNRLGVKSFTYVNASISWTDASDTLNVALWGKNLTNDFTYMMMTGQAGGVDLGGPAPPRTYGVTVGFKFR